MKEPQWTKTWDNLVEESLQQSKGMKRQMTTILALDLGLHTGWALYRDGKIKSGTEDISTTRFESSNRRFVKLRKFLLECQAKDIFGIQIVFFEEVRQHSATDAAHAYGGFLATLVTFCEDNNIDYQGVPVQTLKAYLRKKGAVCTKDTQSVDTTVKGDKKDSKKEVIKVIQKLGYNPKDDNEADAIGLLLYGLDMEDIK